MEGVISRLTDLATAHPTLAVGLVMLSLFALLGWAVIASSYRYR